MYTLKLDWSDERTEAVLLALRQYLLSDEGSADMDVRGAMADILSYRRTTQDVIEEITAERGSYQEIITNVLIEYRKKGSQGEWLTWVFFNPGEEPGDWVYRKLGRPDTRTTLQFRLVRRTAVITDEVLDEEG